MLRCFVNWDGTLCKAVTSATSKHADPEWGLGPGHWCGLPPWMWGFGCTAPFFLVAIDLVHPSHPPLPIFESTPFEIEAAECETSNLSQICVCTLIMMNQNEAGGAARSPWAGESGVGLCLPPSSGACPSIPGLASARFVFRSPVLHHCARDTGENITQSPN